MTKDKNKTTFLSCNTLGNDLNTIIIVALFSLLYRSAAADGGNSPPSDSYGFNGNFNPSIAIIIVVLVSAFFFMGFFSIYIRQCAGESETVRQPNIGRSRRGARGLDPAVIETFPTFIYSVVKGLKLGKNTLECAVCISEFQDEETLRLLPKCNHVFHPDCIDAWLTSHTTCPVCRANLELDPEAVIPESGSEEEIPASADAVVIPIEEASIDTDPPARTGSFRISAPPARSSRWSRFTSGKFPRSHSTGHSLVQSENYERYTLRLPENVRKQMIKAKLNRTTSCVTYATGEESSRGRSLRHNRLEPVAKSDRWAFSRAPPFFSRTFSGHSPKGVEEDGVATSSKPVTQAQAFLPYLRNSFNCLGAGKPEVEEESTRSPVRSPVLPSALP